MLWKISLLLIWWFEHFYWCDDSSCRYHPPTWGWRPHDVGTLRGSRMHSEWRWLLGFWRTHAQLGLHMLTHACTVGKQKNRGKYGVFSRKKFFSSLDLFVLPSAQFHTANVFGLFFSCCRHGAVTCEWVHTLLGAFWSSDKSRIGLRMGTTIGYDNTRTRTHITTPPFFVTRNASASVWLRFSTEYIRLDVWHYSIPCQHERISYHSTFILLSCYIQAYTFVTVCAKKCKPRLAIQGNVSAVRSFWKKCVFFFKKTTVFSHVHHTQFSKLPQGFLAVRPLVILLTQ